LLRSFTCFSSGAVFGIGNQKHLSVRRVIVPSLFIFMVFSRVIIAMPFTTTFFGRLGRYGIEAMVLTLGLLCGFRWERSARCFYMKAARSAKSAPSFSALHKRGFGILFNGYVGGSLYSDITVGVRLFFFQIIAALTTALILRVLFMKKENFTFAPIPEQEKRGGLTEAVVDSTFTMISVCAFIITFSLLSRAFPARH
jgi:hypothetical protein